MAFFVFRERKKRTQIELELKNIVAKGHGALMYNKAELAHKNSAATRIRVHEAQSQSLYEVPA
jgi:hypothetical protein